MNEKVNAVNSELNLTNGELDPSLKCKDRREAEDKSVI